MADPPQRPPARRPPPKAGPPNPTPKNEPDSSYADLEPAQSQSNAKTWIVVVMLCIGMTAGVYYARPYITGQTAGDGEAVASADSGDSKKKKKKKRGKRKKRRAKGQKGSSADYFLSGSDTEAEEDEELWEDEDLVTNDRFRLGDVFEDNPEPIVEEVIERPVEKFIPPPEMYNPSPGYRPTSRWSAPGAVSEDVVEISMSSSGESAPLTGSQIRDVLSVRKLMPCYDNIAKKVPQMQGRVDLKVQIEGNGRVSRVSITRSQLKSKMVEDCIVKTVRRLRFPSSKGERRTRFETHFDFD